MDPRLYPQLQEIEGNHWWFRGRRAVLLSAIQRARLQGATVLDCGCGAGSNVEVLRAVPGQDTLIGIDIDRTPLSFYSTRNQLPASQADAAHLPFPDEAFDLVSALDTIEHVEDDGLALRELYRVCRPGGSLVLTAPAFGFLWGNIDESGHHFRRYSRSTLVRRVREAGFEPRFVRFFNWILFLPIAAVRLLARALPSRGERAGDEVETDFDLVKSGPLNEILARVLALEARLLSLAPPFGVSLLLIADRPAGPD